MDASWRSRPFGLYHSELVLSRLSSIQDLASGSLSRNTLPYQSDPPVRGAPSQLCGRPPRRLIDNLPPSTRNGWFRFVWSPCFSRSASCEWGLILISHPQERFWACRCSCSVFPYYLFVSCLPQALIRNLPPHTLSVSCARHLRRLATSSFLRNVSSLLPVPVRCPVPDHVYN